MKKWIPVTYMSMTVLKPPWRIQVSHSAACPTDEKEDKEKKTVVEEALGWPNALGRTKDQESKCPTLLMVSVGEAGGGHGRVHDKRYLAGMAVRRREIEHFCTRHWGSPISDAEDNLMYASWHFYSQEGIILSESHGLGRDLTSYVSPGISQALAWASIAVISSVGSSYSHAAMRRIGLSARVDHILLTHAGSSVYVSK